MDIDIVIVNETEKDITIKIARDKIVSLFKANYVEDSYHPFSVLNDDYIGDETEESNENRDKEDLNKHAYTSHFNRYGSIQFNDKITLNLHTWCRYFIGFPVNRKPYIDWNGPGANGDFETENWDMRDHETLKDVIIVDENDEEYDTRELFNILDDNTTLFKFEKDNEMIISCYKEMIKD